MKAFGTRGAAEELARVLDGGPVGPATAQLAGVAARLTAAAPTLDALTAPRAEFRAALRTRLVAVATVQQPAAAPAALHDKAVASALAWTRTAARRRTVGVAAGAMASVVAVTGVAVAGNRSLPGQPLYGVKRTTESLQLRTADGPVEKGKRHLQFARERLDEVAALARGRGSVALDAPATGRPLAAGADSHLVRETLADMDDETRAGSRLLLGAARSGSSGAPLRVLQRWSVVQGRELAQLLPLLPGDARTQAAASLELVGAVAADATGLLGAGPSGPSPTPTAVPSSVGSPDASPSAPASSSPTPEPAPAPSTSAPAGSPAPTSGPASPAPTPTGAPTKASSGPLPSVVVPVPSLPVPSLPLPSVPGVPSLPSVPLPSAIVVPLPSLPLPAISPLPLPSLPALPSIGLKATDS